jgi:CubicO group peptidase (beta-lactamase class C family)
VAVVLFTACSGNPANESQSASRPGVDKRVAEAVDSALAVDPPLEAVRAVLVVVDGQPLLERFAGTTAEAFHPVASVTKAVVSTMVGVAVNEGLLDLDDTLAEMLPHYAEQMRPGVAKVTLEALLTMTGGVIANDDPDSAEIFTAPDVVAAALARVVARVVTSVTPVPVPTWLRRSSPKPPEARSSTTPGRSCSTPSVLTPSLPSSP